MQLAPNGRKIILYARVSSLAQKGDLENEVQVLKQFCIGAGQPYDDVWTDVGSVLNYRRQKFRQLITEALNGRLEKLSWLTKTDWLALAMTSLNTFAQCGVELEANSDVLKEVGIEIPSTVPGRTPGTDILICGGPVLGQIRCSGRSTGERNSACRHKAAGLPLSDLTRLGGTG